MNFIDSLDTAVRINGALVLFAWSMSWLSIVQGTFLVIAPVLTLYLLMVTPLISNRGEKE
jgi:hypothetical protein